MTFEEWLETAENRDMQQARSTAFQWILTAVRAAWDAGYRAGLHHQTAQGQFREQFPTQEPQP